MKKIIINFFSILLIVLLVPVLIISVTFGTSSSFDDSFYGGMNIKYNRIKNTEEKKIVVIGGSSVAFGLRSDLLEEELHSWYKVVNFGLYANLGTKFMLDVSRDFINEGDIVIISPEQNAQALSTYINGEATWYAVDGNYEILNHIDREEYKDELFNGFFDYSPNKIKRKLSSHDEDTIYKASSFNDYGDIGAYREKNTMLEGYDPSTPITFDNDIISEDFIQYLNEYHALMSEKGASVYYYFAPMNEMALTETEEASLDTFYSYLQNKISFKILGNPHHSVLAANWFYDSNFHLNTNGQIYHTLNLAKALKLGFNDNLPLINEIPEKPELTIYREYGEYISDRNFVYEYTSEGLTVHALTEEGQKQSSLTIPDTYMDQKIIKLEDELFKDNTLLKSLTLGKNLVSIGNYVFEGTTSLESVYVTSTDPEQLHPAMDIFDDCPEVMIYVPKGTLGDYQTDYFWGRIQGHLKENNSSI